MDNEICPVCGEGELLTEQELIDSMCTACLNADESLGPEQDFDELLAALWQDDGGNE